MAKVLAFLFCSLFAGHLLGQTFTIDGYVFESGNRGFLNVVQLTVFDGKDNELGKVFSDHTGHFVIEVPARFKYKVLAYKDMFEEVETLLDIKDAGDKDKIFTKIEMKRSAGYNFEITLAENRDHDSIVVDAIKNARIEVYNNTKQEEVLVLESHPDPNFDVALLKGNHYTILVRKDGYLGKRMEAFVNVEGCILCFEGIGSVTPGVADNLTEGNEFGVLLANVGLEKIYEGKTIPISNINYEFGKANLDPNYEEGLQSLATIMKDNPDLTVEIGSHTDARGSEQRNFELSRERAQNVVDFLVDHGVNRSRLISKGYGETKLLNDCDNTKECKDYEHRKNRRTELKVIGIAPVKAPVKTLAQIKQMEQGEALLEEIAFGGGIQVPMDSTLIDSSMIESLDIPKDIPATESIDTEEIKVDTIKKKAEEAEMEAKSKLKEKLAAISKKAESEESLEKVEAVKASAEVKTIEVAETITDVQEVIPTSTESVSSETVDNTTDVEEESPKAIVVDIYGVVVKESNTSIGTDNELYTRHSFLTERAFEGGFLYTIGEYLERVEAEAFMRTAKLAYPDAYVVKILGDEIIKL